MTTVLDDAYPLTALQAGMLFHSMYRARAATYNDVLTLTLRGRFDATTLDLTLADLVARHPVLRTHFDLTGFSEPVQLVRRDAPLTVRVVDLSTVDTAAECVRRWADEEQFRAHDLGSTPLRVTVHLLPAGEFTLSVSFHHAILDGWSAASLATEILRRYGARLAGRPLPVAPLATTFADHVAAERDAVASDDTTRFWRAIVADGPISRLPRMPGFPTEATPVTTHLTTALPAPTVDRLAEVARTTRVPLRTVLLAAHLRVIAVLTGGPEVLTGAVTNGRPETDDGTEVLGLFLNLVPVRMRVAQPTWTELIRDVHTAHLDAMPHRRYPLFEMQRLADRSPLCDTAFDFRDFHVYHTLDDDSPRVLALDHLETTDVPFAAAFARARDRTGLLLTLSYDPTQFPPEQMTDVRDLYLTVLDRLAADPAGDPRPTAPLLVRDRARIARWNSTASGARASSLHGMVAARAADSPDATAVTDTDGETSYGDLWRRSCGLANRMRAAGVDAGAVVAVALPRSADAFVAVLGVLQAGGAVLPLDTEHPDRRLSEIVAAAAARLIVTDRTDRFGDTVPVLTTTPDEPPAPAEPARQVHDDALALVLYTSGSTGSPKGVLLSHRAAVHNAAWQAARMGLDDRSRIAQRSPLSVDAAVAEIIMAFSVGGTAVVVPTPAVADPETFARMLTARGVTMTILVPSLLAPHVEAGTFARCPTLRVVASVGEPLPRSLAEAFTAQSTARLYNLYGPTEAGIGVTEYTVDPGHPGATVPIGRPTGDVRLHILNPEGDEVPIGTAGELYVGGLQLAHGYVGRPGPTAGSFVPDHLSGRPGERLYRTGDLARWLPDGVVEFLGRLDGQLKIRGVRTEPGEIEARLLEHPGVRQAVVVPHTHRDRPLLVAYVVCGDPTAPDDLRAHLAERLPRALVPSVYVAVDAIPRLPNGKVDRTALPAPRMDPAGEYVPPRDAVEGRLTVLWEETLGVPMVGVHDDFFALGGHSLHALRLTMLVRGEFGRDLPVASVLDRPTVARLANLVRTPAHLAPRESIVALRDGGTRPPLFFMHPLGGQVFRYHKLARALGADQPVYGIPARGFHADEEPHRSVEAMADDYARRILDRYPHGPYLVGGICVGGNIAVEVARRLREAGERVPLVAAFWSHADNPIAPDQHDDATLMMYALAGMPFELDRSTLAGRSADEQLAAIVAGAAASGILNPAVTDIEQARRLLRVYRANADALGGYRHAPYAGDLALLKPVEDTDFPLEDDFCWREVVTGRFDLVPIPGRRDNNADEPQASQAATILKGLIDRVSQHL